jgi:hypothetical protein
MKKLMLLLLPAMFLFACNNDSSTDAEADEKCCDKEEQCEKKCKNAISVDELMENLEENVDKEVTVRGVCTHICDHSGKNIFVNSKLDDEILIVGKAAEGVEKFDKALEGKEVMVIGKLITVELENEEEIEVHHEAELNYYIEVTEVKECCKGERKHDGTGEHKDHDCDGDQNHTD